MEQLKLINEIGIVLAEPSRVLFVPFRNINLFAEKYQISKEQLGGLYEVLAQYDPITELIVASPHSYSQIAIRKLKKAEL
jgi:hypothetical protein